MYLVGIDIGKLKHSFCLLEKETGEILVEPVFFENNRDGFNALLSSFKHLPQKDPVSDHYACHTVQSRFQEILSAEDSSGKRTQVCTGTLCKKTHASHLSPVKHRCTV